MSALHTEEGTSHAPRSFAVMFMINDCGIHTDLGSSQFQRPVSISLIFMEKKRKIKTLMIKLGRLYSLAEVFKIHVTQNHL